MSTGNPDFDEMIRQIRGEQKPTSIEYQINALKELPADEEGLSGFLNAIGVGVEESNTSTETETDDVVSQLRENTLDRLTKNAQENNTKFPDSTPALVGKLIDGLIEEEGFYELCTSGLDTDSEEFETKIEQQLIRVTGRLIQAKSKCKFDSPEDAYNFFYSVRTWLHELYSTKTPKYIDVSMSLLKKFPNNLVYSEAVDIVEAFELYIS